MSLVSIASCSLFTSAEGRSGQCPSGMVFITNESTTPTHSYCIDKWEGSIVELDGNKKEKSHAPYEPVTNLKVKAVSRAGVIPQGYISRNEAEAACRASKKRLCT